MNLHSFFNGQSFWGKVLGGAFGFIMGGPAGALFGILVGNFFDKGLSQHLNRPYWELYTQRQTPVYHAFINTTFQIMGYIAKADGRVSENAIQFAKHTMEDLRLNRVQIEAAKKHFNAGKAPDFDAFNALTTFKRTMHSHHSLMMSFLSIQYQAAVHDGLSFSRLQALNLVFQSLGFAPIQQQRYYYDENPFSSHQQPPPFPPKQHSLTLAEAFSILNVDTQAPKSTVKQAYRRLISRTHPDKLMAQGKSEVEIKHANDKTQKIRKAYETICAAKGW
jgi:DnaJ like chaperone protein